MLNRPSSNKPIVLFCQLYMSINHETIIPHVQRNLCWGILQWMKRWPKKRIVDLKEATPCPRLSSFMRDLSGHFQDGFFLIRQKETIVDIYVQLGKDIIQLFGCVPSGTRLHKNCETPPCFLRQIHELSTGPWLE